METIGVLKSSSLSPSNPKPEGARRNGTNTRFKVLGLRVPGFSV